MRQRIQQAARLLLVVLLAVSASAATLQHTGDSVAGEVLVKLRAGASQNDVASLRQAADADQSERLAELKSGTLWRLHSRSKNTDALTTALQKNPNVVYAEPNFIIRLDTTPNDTSYGQLWGLKNTGQTINGSVGTAGADIDAEYAWNVTTGSASIVVGVVDTGIDYTHPDLAANVWSNPGGKGNAACAAGTHGFNAITKTCDPMDDNNHGTHVSGTIGAIGNNGAGVAGVNWTASIMGLKFLDSGGYGYTADAITAIDFAVQAKIDGVNVRVLSNSWGGGGFSKALLDVINKANENDILFVASAGNSSYNNDTYPQYPAGYATLNMISVAATDNRDALAYFSNYGPASVHLGAPGVSVLSTVRNNSYASFSGTSMAAPHVSGVAALVLAKTPGLTTAQVKSAILNNTDPIPSLAGKTVTGGRLNAARALGAALPPDFAIGVNPVSRTVVQGAPTTFTVTISPQSGFSSSVDLSLTGLPSGTTASFSPASTTTSSLLTITTSSSTPISSYTLTITGTSGALVRSASAGLSVVAQPLIVPCPTLTYRSSSSVGTPAAIVSADFNRDGKPDLAAASVTSNKVAILLANSSGFFDYSPSYYNVATAPLALAAGDFNGDGKSDLAVANSGSHNVSILLGSGEGTFSAAVHYAAGTSPFGVATGDFNGDGKLDLVTANNGGSNVSILLGAGDGTFQAPVNYGAASGPFWVTVGDFDRDGKADLAVADYNAGKVSVLLGNGNGTFQTTVDYAAGSQPSGVASADFDGDGILDLAVSNFASNNVSILLGNGDGTFLAAVSYAVGSGPSFVAAGDFNGDGRPDLVTANSYNMSILMGTGDGTFLTAILATSPYTYNPSQLTIGDFDADGKADVAVADFYGYVVAMTNTGTCSQNCGTIGAATGYAAGTTPDALAAGDFNRDGASDLAVANSGSNNVSIELGQGDGTFSAGTTLTAGTSPKAVAARDFNGDGKLDLVTANLGSDDVSVFAGNGNGTFQTKVDYAAGNDPRAIVTGDFNQDGKTDLAVANSSSNTVSILLGNGNATFQSAVNYGAGTSPYGLTAGDFNRDGKLDLAVANSGSGNVSILAGNGDGTFQTATHVNAGTFPASITAGDLNRDGKPDLAVANRDSNNISVLLGNGTGGFAAAVQYAAGTNPSGVSAADLNDDGSLDLAVANNGSNNATVLIGDGTGAFAATAGTAAGTGPSAIVTADFNRDGKRDLGVANSGAGTVSILLNTCPVPDLVVTKTHSGTFKQGDTGKTYTITVSNLGGAATQGVVTAKDVLPAGLTATGMSGSGWTCVVSTKTCTRSDALAGGASYPAITVTVNVASSAPSSVTNQATVSGGGELNSVNNTASDPTTITPITDLIVLLTHTGNFAQGATGKTYKIVARNAGSLATSGTVTVADSLPTGLTATAMSGTGWSCTLGTLTCTRSDVLPGGTSYPAITLTVNVAANAPAAVTNTATVSGGGQTNTTNDTAADPTVIWSSQTCGNFGAPVNYTLGYYPLALAVADFNGDSKQDVAAAQSNNKVAIRLGNGDGTFAPSTEYATGGDSPVTMAASDLNQDGKTDLVVGNYYGFSLTVLLGNGDGTFAPAVVRHLEVSGSATPDTHEYGISDLVMGDFNNDTYPDVAVSTQYGGIYVVLGNGDGTLQDAVSYPTAFYPSAIVAADFNGDGKTDLATSSESVVAVLLGNGNGTFQAAIQSAAGNSVYELAVGEFNGDGVPDLAVPNYYDGRVAVLIGAGNGSFAAPAYYTTFYGTNSVAVDDLNGDGKQDIASGSSYYYNVAVLYGNGAGSFQNAVTYSTGGASDLTINDFNGDGRADLAFTGYYSYQFSIMYGGCADLTITKTHSGNFQLGSSATYTLTVRNSGGAASSGTVTVTDVLPTGLTATGMSGSGWTCDLPTRTCTRSDSLANGANYPDITLYVNVAANAPSGVTNVATVTGGNDSNTTNNSASDLTKIGALIFNDGWEQMQTLPGRWAGKVPSGAASNNVTVTNAAQRGPNGGFWGLQVTLQDVAPRNAAYVYVGPAQGFSNETTIRGTFFIDPQGINITGLNSFQMIDFIDTPGGHVQLIFHLQQDPNTLNYHLNVWHWNQLLNGGAGNWAFAGGGFLALKNPAWRNNRIDFVWNNGNPGHLTMWRTLYTNGAPDASGTVQMFSNDLPGMAGAVINYVFAGMFASHDPGTSGVLYLDEFAFSR